MTKISLSLSITLLAAVLLTACVQGGTTSSGEGKLKVFATTTIVGDVVAQVGGERIDLSILLPVGTDPHGFDPSPREIAKVAEADVVFANGADLEDFLDNLIESAGVANKVVYVSEGVDFLKSEVTEYGDESEEHNHKGADPHTWTDPNNVITWVENIERALRELDPENAKAYQDSAVVYIGELKALDSWIQEQVVLVADENRHLVTDHALFSYFANTYGFEQVGTLIPGYSTLAEPTARELAEIEDVIINLEVQAVFVGNTVNPALAERVAEDLDVQLVFLYTGSLSEAGGDAASYIEYMRYNTTAIVEALK